MQDERFAKCGNLSKAVRDEPIGGFSNIEIKFFRSRALIADGMDESTTVQVGGANDGS